MNPADRAIGQLLQNLGPEDVETAWTFFLSAYSETIFGVVRGFAQTDDQANDCFLFVCERLAGNNCRRLRAFRPDGKAQFSTWLRAVVRNLCLDWYRSKYGRRGLFRSIASRDAIDQEIFAATFLRGSSVYEIWLDLSRKGLSLSYADIEKRIEQLRGLLTNRQVWLVSTARTNLEARASDQDEAIQLRDGSPSPETLAILRETESLVRKALKRLDTTDRILLRLRYLEGLPLAEVARLVGLKDAQTADRRVREALERLRKHLPSQRLPAGKPKSASV